MTEAAGPAVRARAGVARRPSMTRAASDRQWRSGEPPGVTAQPSIRQRGRSAPWRSAKGALDHAYVVGVTAAAAALAQVRHHGGAPVYWQLIIEVGVNLPGKQQVLDHAHAQETRRAASVTPVTVCRRVHAAGTVLHFAFGAFLGVAFAAIIGAAAQAGIPGMRTSGGIVTAGVIGGAFVYVIMRWGLLPPINPLMPFVPQIAFLLAHLLFGLVVGIVLAIAFRRPRLLAALPTSR